MTKEKVLRKLYHVDDDSDLQLSITLNPEVYYINKAMDIYSQQQALLFVEYRDRFKTEESRRVKKEADKLGGMFSWRGASDKNIYDLFISKTPIKSEMNQGYNYQYNDKDELELIKIP